MTRHAKNCTAGAVYTYHEKKRDTKASGYGTQSSRLGKDSVKDFDCCSLTLQPCRDPVLTPYGILYDKEAIYEYIIKQKREIARKMKEYDSQKNKEQNELAELGAAEERSKIEKFVKKEKSITTPHTNGFHSAEPQPSTSISNMTSGRNQQLPSFWIPSLTPESKSVQIKKPDKTVYCPMSGKPLKAKDLISIHFVPVKDPDDKAALITKKNRYMCAVTHDILGNTVPAAVLKTSGSVVTMECIEKLIKKDMIDPTNGKQLTEADIIPMQMGGTGYASTNERLEGKHKRPVLQA